jgi:translation initiation factor 2B subunit (eIF-2B alpha/beta/delta family)
MVKKFTVPCDFSGKKFPITFYVGDAVVGNHPIGFQSKWLSDERGGTVPKELMDSLAKLKEISDQNKVSFEELCAYVIDEINITNANSATKEKKKKLSSEAIKKKQAEQIKRKRALENQQLKKDRS